MKLTSFGVLFRAVKLVGVFEGYAEGGGKKVVEHSC